MLISFSLMKSSLVQQGRNLLVSEFMNAPEKYDYLLFIDSDIDFQSKTIFTMIEKDKDLIEIIYPEDYTNLLLRTLLIPNNSQNMKNAEIFIDYILSEEVQNSLEQKSGLPSIYDQNIIENYNSKPIRLDTGLLVFLDRLKRKQFLSEWNSAINQ